MNPQNTTLAEVAIFKIGEGVRLRSSGPLMTVRGRTKRGVECCWFDNCQNKRRSAFPPAALEHQLLQELTDEELKFRLTRL